MSYLVQREEEGEASGDHSQDGEEEPHCQPQPHLGLHVFTLHSGQVYFRHSVITMLVMTTLCTLIWRGGRCSHYDSQNWTEKFFIGRVLWGHLCLTLGVGALLGGRGGGEQLVSFELLQEQCDDNVRSSSQ